MAEELEEQLIESEEEIYEVSEDEIGFEEEEYTSGELSWKQKLILINSGILAFVFFIFLIFPYEELIRTYIYKIAAENNFVLEFRKLNLSIFSNTSIDHLIYQNKDNTEIRAESIELDASIWDLMKKNFKGNVSITSLNLELTNYAVKANTVNLEDSSLIGFDRDMANINGSLNLQVLNGTILRSPVIPILDSLQGVKIKSIQLSMKKTLNSNRVIIEKGIFSLSIAKINVSGYIELATPVNASRIELKVCPKLSEEYKVEREDIASSLEVMTKDLQDGCIPVSGTIGTPKVNMPGIQQPPSTNPPVLTPIPSPNSPPQVAPNNKANENTENNEANKNKANTEINKNKPPEPNKNNNPNDDK